MSWLIPDEDDPIPVHEVLTALNQEEINAPVTDIKVSKSEDAVDRLAQRITDDDLSPEQKIILMELLTFGMSGEGCKRQGDSGSSPN